MYTALSSGQNRDCSFNCGTQRAQRTQSITSQNFAFFVPFAWYSWM